MNFGSRENMLKLADKRLKVVKKSHSKAQLLDAGDVNVIYLVAYAPSLYHEFSVASNSGSGITRQLALKKMVRPLTAAVSQLL
jgi:formate dehydrogenase iron-sulfur subunit